jgi:hypothetical protein
VPAHQGGEGVLVTGDGKAFEQLLVGRVNGGTAADGDQVPDDGP